MPDVSYALASTLVLLNCCRQLLIPLISFHYCTFEVQDLVLQLFILQFNLGGQGDCLQGM